MQPVRAQYSLNCLGRPASVEVDALTAPVATARNCLSEGVRGFMREGVDAADPETSTRSLLADGELDS
jgi:hypothetical protein